MPTIAQLVAEIHADNKQLIAGLNQANQAINKFALDAEKSLGKGMQKASRAAGNQLESLSSRLSGFGAKLSLSLTAPIAAASKSAFDAAVKFDSFERAMGTIMGSAESARKEIEQLRIASNLPGVTFENALRASQQFQAAGFSAMEARTMIVQFGNEAARVGVKQDEMERMIVNIRQIAGMSRLTGDELREMSAIIPTIGKHIKAAFGTTETEKIAKMGVTGRQAIEAIAAGFEKAPRAPMNTVQKDIERVQTSLFLLKTEAAKIFMPFARQIMDMAVPAMEALSQKIKSLSEEDKSRILKIVGAIALIGPTLVLAAGAANALLSVKAVIGGLFTGFTSLAGAVTSAGGVLGILKGLLVTLTGPIGVIVGLIAALALAFQTNFAGVRDILLPVWKSIKDFFAEISQSIQVFVSENAPLFTEAWENIRTFLVPFFQQMAHTIAGAWEVIKNVIRIALDVIMRWIKLGAQIITGDWSGAWSTIVEGFSKTWNRMKLIAFNGVLSVLNVMKSFGSAMGSAIGINFTVLDNSIKLIQEKIQALEQGSKIAGGTQLSYSSRVELEIARRANITGPIGGRANITTPILSFKPPVPPMRFDEMKLVPEVKQKKVKEIDSLNEKVIEKSKELAEALAEQSKQFREQIFLLGKETEVQRMLWEITEGKFKSSDRWTKIGLIAGAATLDNLRKEFQDRSNLTNLIKGEIDSFKERIAMFGKETEMEKLLASIQLGRYKGATFFELMLLQIGAQRIDQMNKELDNLDAYNRVVDQIRKGEFVTEWAGAGFFGGLSVMPMLKRKLSELKTESEATFRELKRSIEREWESLGLSGRKLLEKQLKDDHPFWSDQKIKDYASWREKVDQARTLIEGLGNRLHETFMKILDDLFKNGFRNFFNNVIQGFRDMIAQIASDIISSQLKALIQNVLAGMMPKGKDPSGDSGASGWAPFFGSILGSIFKPRAMGGPIFAGEGYLVGERGPEIFMPNRSGMMVPNHELAAVGSGGPINLTLNISTPDVASFRRNEGQIMADAMASARRAAYRNGGR